MNRTLFLGIALFLAVVGYALTGAEKQAAAGHRCHGCNAAADCGGGDCNGGCHKSRRCHRERCHRERCHGRCHKCDGGCSADCGAGDCGGAAPAKDAPKEAPKSTSIEENAPLAFRSVSFVR